MIHASRKMSHITRSFSNLQSLLVSNVPRQRLSLQLSTYRRKRSSCSSSPSRRHSSLCSFKLRGYWSIRLQMSTLG